MNEPVSELELDALREVANIGGGHAADALARLLGGRVSIGLPEVLLASAAELPELLGGRRTRVLAAVFSLEGDLKGHLLLVLTERDAARLCAHLLSAPCGPSLDDVQRSALSEAANIVASACLSAIGRFTGLTLLLSTPSLSAGTAGPVVDKALSASGSATGLLVALKSRFQSAGTTAVGGQLWVVPERQSLRTLLAKLGV